MRKLTLFLVLLLIPTAVFAQGDWRNRPSRYDRRYAADNMFELTPFIGYRYGGTLYASQSSLFNRDVDVASAMNYGAQFGIPVGYEGMKIELMVNRQDTNFTTTNGLFSPDNNLANFHITYYQAGVEIPFARSRNAIPFFVVGAGFANLKPDVPGVGADNRFAANAGIGVKIPISPNIGFRIDARGYFTSLNNSGCNSCYYNYNHDLYQGETNFGVVFKF
jgi:outer membrane protein with beta-barrel domain